MLQISSILLKVKLRHLVLRLQLLNESWVSRNGLLQSPVLFILFPLREHERTELLKMGLEIGGVLLFLKITQMSVFHRR